MNKKEEIISLINQIGELQKLKIEAIKNQKYEEALIGRVDEKVLSKKLDLVSGVDDFYKKVYNSEKILQHIKIITNSLTELKNLTPNFEEIIDTSILTKWGVKLVKERDEAYVAALQLKGLIK